MKIHVVGLSLSSPSRFVSPAGREWKQNHDSNKFFITTLIFHTAMDVPPGPVFPAGWKRSVWRYLIYVIISVAGIIFTWRQCPWAIFLLDNNLHGFLSLSGRRIKIFVVPGYFFAFFWREKSNHFSVKIFSGLWDSTSWRHFSFM